MRCRAPFVRLGIWLLLVLCVGRAGAGADQPLPLPQAPLKQATYADLSLIGQALADLPHYRDNVFLYQKRQAELLRAVTQYVGAEVELEVEVDRVTWCEVVVRVRRAGKTRVIVRHATPPWFGDLETVWYTGDGSLATLRNNIFTKPVALRIGSEVSYDLAHDLRRGQVLLVRGYIESSELALDLFEPAAVVVVAGIRAEKVVPGTESYGR